MADLRSEPKSSLGGHGADQNSKPPPNDQEAEASVLGAILLADRWIDPIVLEIGLTADDFYRPRHRHVFEAMLALQGQGEPIDTLTVGAQLEELGLLDAVGGKDYIETLVVSVPALANTKQYGQIVKENALLRNLLAASRTIQDSVNERGFDAHEILEQAQQSVFSVAQEHLTSDFTAIEDLLHTELEKLEELSIRGKSLTGTPSGFRELDELTGGFQPGNLIIIAGRPAMGKSALVTNIAENASMLGHPVALFSLEMSATELAQRFIASNARIEGDKLRKGTLPKSQWPKVLKSADLLAKAPLWIDDSSDLNILEMRSKARRLHGKSLAANGRGLGAIIIDYLQLLRTTDPRASRTEQVGQMSRGLKILAQELQVPVIALSQLSRAVESRVPPKPQLSDLRESGQLEQDADLVAFIYREEYYLRDESDRPGEADIIVAKHRNGPIRDIPLTFVKHYPKFANLPHPGSSEQARSIEASSETDEEGKYEF